MGLVHGPSNTDTAPFYTFWPIAATNVGRYTLAPRVSKRTYRTFAVQVRFNSAQVPATWISRKINNYIPSPGRARVCGSACMREYCLGFHQRLDHARENTSWLRGHRQHLEKAKVSSWERTNGKSHRRPFLSHRPRARGRGSWKSLRWICAYIKPFEWEKGVLWNVAKLPCEAIWIFQDLKAHAWAKLLGATT